MVREKVKAGALWYIYNIQELIDELENGPDKMGVVSEATVSAFKKAMFGGFDAGRRVGSPATLTAN